jgi:hypothetical protein
MGTNARSARRAIARTVGKKARQEKTAKFKRVGLTKKKEK